MTSAEMDDWLEAESALDELEEAPIGEYDLTSTPNDFNVKTIIDFVNSGVFLIPSFQRNYVWDIKRASRLIESIILGLPIPQLFLYEEGRNRFLVIDGQQRLLSLFFFVQKRFPLLDRRGALRRLYDQTGELPRSAMADDEFFTNFNLQLPSPLPAQQNRFNKLNYDTLGEHRTSFDLRTIRCVFIKQNEPKDDDSSVYEIFNRLNTGGMNLTPQEIRTSLYHSEFYRCLYRLNIDERWRALLGAPDPDLRLRDVELLLRAFAMLIRGDRYAPSMTRFLNKFSKDMRRAPESELTRLSSVFDGFLTAAQHLPQGAFGTRGKKVNISIFEAVFAACCARAYIYGGSVTPLDEQKLTVLKSDKDFSAASTVRTTDRGQVEARLKRARELLIDA
jgi:uncharacterized protein with ParB-like and HNH nuclease domain